MKTFVIDLLTALCIVAGYPLVASAAGFTVSGPTNIAVVGSPSISNMTRGGKYNLTASGLPGNGFFGNPQSGVPTVYVNNVAQQSWYYTNSNKVGFLANIAGNWTSGESVGVYVTTSTGLT